jgi:hypothetical protein
MTAPDEPQQVSEAPAQKDAARSPSPPGRRRRRWRRIAASLAVATPLAGAGLWIAVHRIPWMGPAVANGLRAVVGTDNVAQLEDFVYAMEDRVNQLWRKDEAPKAYWEVPTPAPAKPEPALPAEPAEATRSPQLPPFSPVAPGPMHKSLAAKGDGQWVPMPDPRRPEDPPRMFKTLLHADKTRSWSEVFIVALDLRQVEVHPVAGYQEPASDLPEAQNYERFAKIPEKHHGTLLAAFNGGFMAEHGHYGMKLDGVTLLPGKEKACTLAQYEDGSLRVASWPALADSESRMVWFRQAPPCMYEDGKLNPLLLGDFKGKWGATLDGNTVIRRSAVGLNEDRDILFVAITNHTTARVLADAMRHVGAVTVAQMDVNWSYPKFVTYEPVDGALKPIALASGFEFDDNLYIRHRSMRDFFYVTRKDVTVAASR